MQDDLTYALREARGRIYWRLVGCSVLRGLAWCGFLGGFALLFLRLLGGAGCGLPMLVCALAGWLLWGMASLWLRSRQLPSKEALVAWLDARSHGGGLLLAEFQEGGSRWRGRRGAIAVPSIRWESWRREALLALCALAFLLGVAFAPQRMQDDSMTRRVLDIQDETAQIESQLEILENTLAVEPEKLQEMKNLLADIYEHNVAGDSAKTYELLDLLQERIDKEISECFNETLEDAMGMDRLASVLERLSQLQQNPEAVTASSEIGRFIAQLASEDAELAALLQEIAADGQLPSLAQLEEAGEKGLTPEQQRQLAEFLRKNADRIREKLKRMAEQMKHKGCSSCGNQAMQAAEFDLQALEDWLNANGGGECSQSMALAMQSGCMGGEGGVGRGRGDAPLEYTNTAKDFEHTGTDIGVDGMALAENTSVLKRSLIAPENAEKEAKAPVAGTLSGGQGKVKASARPIHPQHRREVETYFMRRP